MEWNKCCFFSRYSLLNSTKWENAYAYQNASIIVCRAFFACCWGWVFYFSFGTHQRQRKTMWCRHSLFHLEDLSWPILPSETANSNLKHFSSLFANVYAQTHLGALSLFPHLRSCLHCLFIDFFHFSFYLFHYNAGTLSFQLCICAAICVYVGGVCIILRARAIDKTICVLSFCWFRFSFSLSPFLIACVPEVFMCVQNDIVLNMKSKTKTMKTLW